MFCYFPLLKKSPPLKNGLLNKGLVNCIHKGKKDPELNLQFHIKVKLHMKRSSKYEIAG